MVAKVSQTKEGKEKEQQRPTARERNKEEGLTSGVLVGGVLVVGRVRGRTVATGRDGLDRGGLCGVLGDGGLVLGKGLLGLRDSLIDLEVGEGGIELLGHVGCWLFGCLVVWLLVCG